MNSLKEVYFAIAETDHVKVAQAQAAQEYGPSFADVDPGLIKQAQDYDAIGRIMAHNVFTDMVKEAMDEMYPHASEEDKKKETDKVVAEAKGEGKSDEEKEEERKKKEREAAASGGDEGGDEGSEKKAAVKAAVLQRMQEDPEYVSHLLSKYEIV
jgi:hypothetical protein